MKSCPVANYCKKMRQILEKIEENSKFIENERKNYTGTLADQKQIQAWEANVRNQGTPLTKFYENWEKVNQVQKKKKANQTEEIADYNLPTLAKGIKRKQKDDDDGPVELFPSDSEDEEIPKLGPKQKRGKRGSKKNKQSIDEFADVEDEGDVVVDAKASDW